MSDPSTSPRTPAAIAAGLPCWSGPVEPRPLHGGLTNTNFVVRDGGDTFVVRIGDDLPLHGVVRSNELATCIAAHACGLSPEIVHHQSGAMVMRFIEATTLTADDIRRPATRQRVVDLLRRCHSEMARHRQDDAVTFSVFAACRSYISTAGRDGGRLAHILAELGEQNERLEQSIGTIRPVFCHNDLLAANFLDDGESLWLLDWEYAGWNSAFFDLANLASNNEMNPEQETSLLETYFDHSPQPHDLARFRTMKCASLLREALWSLVQEQHSALDFDYASYTDDHLRRFRLAYRHLETTP
jgi:thiamine kinase-like enzyme